ncbi:MAG: ABC transporter ATP-binding protein [Ruminococcaceae bacterium]|nr:ABC transporter ATP-binding protein [Oscillospiraceae bacterium]
MKLKIEHLFSGYDSDVVLKDLSLEAAEGEFLSLLGPSGCGKSTLMKTIAGIVPASSGRILLDGQDITNLPIHKRGTVVVFQDMRLFPHKSVAENVAFPLKMQGVPKQERLKTAETLLEKVRMAGFGSRKPGELSGGQQQRIALARALAAQPKLLLLDEPFSALDENLREDMRHLVLQLQKEFSMTVILVTHDREEALSMSDRVALLFDGKLSQIGTPREVYEQPETKQVADYFGNCVYIPGHVENGVFTATGIRCCASVPDGAYRIMLRPDCLDLNQTGTYVLQVEEISFRGTDSLICLRSQDGTLWKKSCAGPVALQIGDIVNARLTVTNPVLFP